MPESLDDFFPHIKQLHHQRTDLTLNRVNAVADRLQLQNFSCPVITVGGTNGKGSTVKTLESIYFQAGFKTALYTSPHLLHFNERIRINNENITDDDLLRAFIAVENARQKIILSFFEFITLSALFLFQQAKCDVVILEVGLGGQFDAVNIVDSDISVVTSIGLDHMHLLGNTRESIAYQKACIVRAKKPFICGEENPPDIIEKTVAEKGGLFFQIQRDFFYKIKNGQMQCVGKNFAYHNLPLPQLKPQNIATAIAVVNALQNKLSVSEKNIADGIQKTKWPGRFEVIYSPIPCVLDVAHNPQAAAWLAKQYQALPPVKNTVAVVGMLKDKAMVETISHLLPFVNKWYVCSLEQESIERGADGATIAAHLTLLGKSYDTFASVSDALYSLEQNYCADECDRALIFGSFYTVAAAKQWLLKGEKKWKKK